MLETGHTLLPVVSSKNCFHRHMLIEYNEAEMYLPSQGLPLLLLFSSMSLISRALSRASLTLASHSRGLWVLVTPKTKSSCWQKTHACQAELMYGYAATAALYSLWLLVCASWMEKSSSSLCRASVASSLARRYGTRHRKRRERQCDCLWSPRRTENARPPETLFKP